VVTRAGPDRFRILAGERRFTAAKELGWAAITVIVRSVEEQQRKLLQLVENVQREDLDPFEQGDAFQRLRDEHGLNEEEIGKRVSKAQDYVSRMLIISRNIPAEIRDDFYVTSRKYPKTQKVPSSILLEIARARTPERQRALWESAKEGKLTVRQVRQARAEGAETRAQSEEEQAPERPTREIIQLDRATVTIQCESNVGPDAILVILQEATRRWKESLGSPSSACEDRQLPEKTSVSSKR
jgi:ParB family chromosome partitioning protein